jgi:hypothetical protein
MRNHISGRSSRLCCMASAMIAFVSVSPESVGSGGYIKEEGNRKLRVQWLIKLRFRK